VALGQQTDQHPLDEPVLPDDHPFDLEHGAFEQLRVMGRGSRPGLGFRHGPNLLEDTAIRQGQCNPIDGVTPVKLEPA
jgi:hypothetical protein